MNNQNWINEKDTKNPVGEKPAHAPINPIMEGMPNNQWKPVPEDPVQYRDQQRRGLQFVMGFVRTGGGPLGKVCAIYQKQDQGDFVIVSKSTDNPNDIRVFEMTNEFYGDPNPDPTDMVRRVLEMADSSGMNRNISQYGNFGKIIETAELDKTGSFISNGMNNLNSIVQAYGKVGLDTKDSLHNQAIMKSDGDKKVLNAFETVSQSVLTPLDSLGGRGMVGNTQTGAVQRAHPLAEKMMGAFGGVAKGLFGKVANLKAGQKNELTAGQVAGVALGGAKQSEKKGLKEIKQFENAYGKRTGLDLKSRALDQKDRYLDMMENKRSSNEIPTVESRFEGKKNTIDASSHEVLPPKQKVIDQTPQANQGVAYMARQRTIANPEKKLPNPLNIGIKPIGGNIGTPRTEGAAYLGSTGRKPKSQIKPQTQSTHGTQVNAFGVKSTWK